MEKAKILVVEDEGIIAKDIERILRDLGYNVPARATSGEEAVQKALETQPDLILMDIVLKGEMDGVEAAEQIRARLGIPVVFLTAYVDEATLQRAKVIEPFGYLLKPFQEKELQSTIEIALYKCRMEKRLKEKEQWLAVTLKSINDGVMTVQEDGSISFMNPVAEILTGWKEAEAIGRPLDDVFRSILESKGEKADGSEKKAMGAGFMVHRTDQMVLTAKDGYKRRIDFSAAPLRDDQGNALGAVLAFRDITEQKRAERALQGERDRLEMITQNIGAGVAVISRDYRTIWANKVLKEISGETEGKICHSTHNQRKEICSNCGAKEVFEKQSEKVVHEQMGKDKNGEQIWSEIITTPIKDQQGSITAALELVVPITGRKRAEEASKKSEEEAKRLAKENEIIAEIGRVISSSQKIEGVYESFAEGVKQLIPTDRLVINLINYGENTARLAYVSGNLIPSLQAGDVFPFKGSLNEILAQSRSGLITQPKSAEELAEFPSLARAFQAGFRSMMAVPLISGDRVIGGLHFRSQKTNAYTPQDLSLAQRIANQIAGAIANVQLFSEAAQITGALRESERRYRTLIEAVGQSGDAMFTLQDIGEKEAVFVSANDVAQKITGYSLEELRNLSWMDIVQPSLLKTVRDRYRRRMRGDQMPGIYEYVILNKNGEKIPIEITATVSQIQGQPTLICFFREITQRKQVEEALKQSKEFNENILNSINEALAIIDVRDFKLLQFNKAFLDLVGMEAEKVTGKICYEMNHNRTTPCDSADHICPILNTLKTGDPSVAEHVHYAKNGAKRIVEVSSSPIRNERGEIIQVVHLERDITEKRNLESQLIQAQKLEAIGQLAAGIAHEINTPTQYVGDNTRFFQDAFKELKLLLDQYGLLLAALKEGHPPDALIREVEATAEKIDLPFLSREIPMAIEQTLEGVNRVANIVRAMREFSHPGTKEKSPLHLNRALENAIAVSRNEWKYVAEVVTDLDPSLPPVPCLPQELNQAILNIIINAAHAIADALGQPPAGKGAITISTRREGDWAEIRIRDTGTGIPAEIQSKVFEPFFTTKKVGRGTGQGLTIAHAVIMKKHGGTIHFETEAGKGTTFIIRLPLSDPAESLSPAGSPAEKAA